MENWNKIVDYPNYEVSDFGNVRNVKTKNILNAGLGKRGYFVVILSNSRKQRKTHTVHRLVATAFIENPNDKQQVDHIDNNKINNAVNNLRWCTNKENSRNRNLNKNNSSGCKGVAFLEKVKKWRARIMIDGIDIHLGLFDNFDDAKQARVNKVNQVFGQFTNFCEKI
jgi:hypothetical protein